MPNLVVTTKQVGAIVQNGEVLDILVQVRRDKCAALKLMRKLLKK